MPSNYETFWDNERFAVVGNTEKKNFPRLTYAGLKDWGKTVYAVDPSVEKMDGDPVYADLSSLPGDIDAVVLETPQEDTAAWVEQAAEAGVKDVWIHMTRDTPEALELAKDKGINVRHGTCAVMYVTQGFSGHSFHKWINKLIGKY